ncbi:uncharacterized protein JCM6883_005716 [Sporobolomyces salmoneus]|uniref:uncharacterized protein n=1 Tax=Sporobolomyces salmoneus TaxID=183962 RepID=UPI003174169E
MADPLHRSFDSERPLLTQPQESEDSTSEYVLPPSDSVNRERLRRTTEARRKQGRENVCEQLDNIIALERRRAPAPPVYKLPGWKQKIVDFLDAKGMNPPLFHYEYCHNIVTSLIELQKQLAKSTLADSLKDQIRRHLTSRAQGVADFLEKHKADIVLEDIGLKLIPPRPTRVSKRAQVVGRVQAFAFSALNPSGRRKPQGDPSTEGYSPMKSLSHRTLSSRQVGGVYGFESLGEAESGGHYF